MAAASNLDVLLLGLEACGNSIETARTIRHTQSKTKIVILTSSDDEDLVLDALRAGVHGYVHKEVSGAELIRAIESIHRGEPHVAPALASRLLSRLVTGGRTLPAAQESTDLIRLTSRERQVLDLISEGLTNREIAIRLGISVKTIKQFTMLIFSKMGVRNRVEATIALRKSNGTPHRLDLPRRPPMPNLIEGAPRQADHSAMQ